MAGATGEVSASGILREASHVTDSLPFDRSDSAAGNETVITERASLHNRKRRQKVKSSSDEILPDTLELAEFAKSSRIYRSNIFGLEIESLLKEVSINYLKLSPLENFVKFLKEKIDNMNAKVIEQDYQKQYPFMHFMTCAMDQAFQFRSPSRCDLVGSYLLQTIVRPSLNVDIAVEMPAEMFAPKDVLNHRYFNKRAAYVAEMFKQLRRMFPYTISEEKNVSSENQDFSRNAIDDNFRPYFFIEPFFGDCHRPFISVKLLIPREDAKFLKIPTTATHRCTSWTIRIFPIPPKEFFNEAKLTPVKNAVRFISTSRVPDHVAPSLIENKFNGKFMPPTPMYNGALLDDIRMRDWFERLYTFKQNFNGYTDAVKLLKVWLTKKKIGCYTSSKKEKRSTNNITPISGFLLSIIASHVCLTASIIHSSSIEIFKLSLIFLKDFDNSRKYFYGKKKSMELTDEEKNLQTPLFYDSDKTSSIETYNIFWQIRHFLPELAYWAKQTLNSIELQNDPFMTVFGTSFESPFVHDMELRILPADSVNDIPHEDFIGASLEDDAAKSKNSLCGSQFGAPYHFNIAASMLRLLRRGLADRLSSEGGTALRFCLPSCNDLYSNEHPVCPPPFSWTDISCNQKFHSSIAMPIVFIGLKLTDDARLLWSLVDRGVAADCELAPFFKSFWGISSIRRFQDGSINQSIVWRPPTITSANLGHNLSTSGTSTTTVPAVSSQIIQHLLKRHMKNYEILTPGDSERRIMTTNQIIYFTDASLGHPMKPTMSLTAEAENTVAAPLPYESFRELKEIIMMMKDLPLDVKSFEPSDPCCALKNVHPPQYCPYSQNTTPPCQATIMCVLEFGKSSGWPSAKGAIKRMKAAFLLKIMNNLNECPSINAKISSMAQDLDVPADPYLDVRMGQSKELITDYVFRIRIFYALEHCDVSKPLVEAETDLDDLWKVNSSLTQAEVISDIRCLWWQPIVTAQFHIASESHFSLSQTSHLLRLWAASHLFPIDIVQNILDHICLSVFLNPIDGGPPPSSPHVAFLRCLHLLATHQWQTEGLYINYMKDEIIDIDKLLGSFKRCCDAVMSAKSNESVLNSPYGIRRPYFWISSKFDPHCVLLPTPNHFMSEEIVFEARRTLRMYNEEEFRIESGCIIPHLNWIDGRKESILFSPRDFASRFHIEITLQGLLNVSGNSNWRKQNKTKPKEFANLRKKDATGLNLFTAAELLNDVTTALKGKKNSDSYKSMLMTIFTMSPGVFDSSQDVVTFLRNSFYDYIRRLRQELGSTAGVNFNSLCVPFPKSIFIRFDRDASILRSLSFTSCNSIPKLLLEMPIKSDSSDDEDNEESNIHELMHAPMWLGKLISQGMGLVEDIRIL